MSRLSVGVSSSNVLSYAKRALESSSDTALHMG